MQHVSPLSSFEYRPVFPKNSGDVGIGLVGFGRVAKKWHLTAYRKYGLKVIGVYDISPEALVQTDGNLDGLHIFESLDELLNHPDIHVVDIATRPAGRAELIRQALQADKHVLAQKPLAINMEEASSITEEAERRGLKLAVNHNGRWAPPWRLASLLIRDGAIGDIQSVTHLYDTRLTWKPNPLHGSPHFFIYDYSIHWIDITRCWLEDKKLSKVRAQDLPAPKPLADGSIMQSMWLLMEYADSTSAVIRGVGCGHVHAGHPFWIHGTEGTIRGSVDSKRGDYVELEKDGVRSQYELEGNWFPDGFAGAMGELLSAVAEDREPYNSARHHLLTLEATLAACRSADQSGAGVDVRL